MMEVKVADIFQSLLDGGEYIVKRIVNSMVLLELRDGKKEIVTSVSSLNITSFYRKKDTSETPIPAIPPTGMNKTVI